MQMTAGADTQTIVDWLVGGARSATSPEGMLTTLYEGLVAAGIPLCCATVFVRTLHPQVMGRRFHWRQAGGIEIAEASYGSSDRPETSDSLLSFMCETGDGFRRRLINTAACSDSSLLTRLYSEGATDYLARPLIFSDRSIHMATWTTREPGGFTAEHITAIDSIIAPLARVAEIYALRRTATNLLDTYVGRNAGERILSGAIRRGDTLAIEAVIWLSDMRGFTARADRLPPQALIDLLNRYFDCQVPTILARGGEVLKFMGDGLLAIFPTTRHGNSLAEACANSVGAAMDVRDNIAALNASLAPDTVRFGLALHLGEVLYGNIGSSNRLDFTCIGPAVNLAARIEKLTANLGRTVLVSSAFSRYCTKPLTPVGEFALAGFSAAQPIFGLSDEP
jgi:adenylate cyclase